MATICPNVFRSPCFPLVLVLLMDGCAKIGLTKAMGVLFEDVSRDLQMTSTDLGIALGLLISVGNAASPIVMALYRRCLNPRLFMMVGALTSPVCIILSSLATRTTMLLVAFAISSLAHAAVRMPSIILLSGLAGDNFNILYSLSTCGYSMGMIIYPFLAEVLLSAYGWRGVLLILAGIMFHEIPCLMAIQIPSTEILSGNRLQDANASHHDSQTELEDEITGPECQQTDYQEADEINDKDGIASDRDMLLASSDKTPHKKCDNSHEKSPDGFGHLPFSLFSCRFWSAAIGALKNWFRGTVIYADPLSLSIFLSFASVQFVYSGWVSFLVPHALQRGTSPHNIILLTFCAAVGSITARFSVAFLTHRLIRPLDMYLALTTLNAVALMIDVYIPKLIIMFLVACCSGVTTSGRSILAHLVVRKRTSVDHLAMSLAVLEVFGGSAVYLGGYATGLVADKFSSYDASFKLLAMVEILAFFFMLPVRIEKRQDKPSSTQD